MKLFALALLLAAPALAQKPDYKADIEFALDQLEENCGHFFKTKDVDWRAVRKEMTKDAKKVKTNEEHYVLLWRLLARLEDGHAQVRPTDATKGIQWDDGLGPKTGPGMFWCKVGKQIYVKNAWASAQEVGIGPGWEVVKVDGQKASDWLEERVAELTDVWSFSTDHQAFFYACHWGLEQPISSRLKLELKDAEGKKRKKTVTYTKASTVPNGPAYYPCEVKRAGDIYYGKTRQGHAYVHVRRCKSALPEQIDEALKAVGDAPGLTLDFRGNSGGGFDHDAVLGRFVPEGKTMRFAKAIPSAGPQPYTGPVVVIVDATARSAGETGSGMFKEDGRAYMIGESPTAGMSSSKTTIDLPSGLFQLYVSVASNKGRFNGGRGIEGIGVIPHEIVEFDPQDLVAEIDTLIRIAGERLADFPQDKVPYDPADF